MYSSREMYIVRWLNEDNIRVGLISVLPLVVYAVTNDMIDGIVFVGLFVQLDHVFCNTCMHKKME